MWTEILKDFFGAFLLGWWLLPIMQTILSVPLSIVSLLFPSADYTAARRHLKLLFALLAVLLGLLVHGGWDWLSIHLSKPQSPPLRLNLSDLI